MLKQLFVLSTCILIAIPSVLGEISGELKQWHTVTVSFEGPETSEDATPNPFIDYRLDVTFTQGENSYVVPGYYAADGNAGETSATSGNIWKVHFTPDATGEWTYKASFRNGENVAVSDEPDSGEGVYFHGESGSFTVTESDKSGKDLRAHGRLNYAGKHYLQFAGSKKYYLKSGADSPENFLAFAEFDGYKPEHDGVGQARDGEAALAPTHHYKPHVQDWKDGDPVWKDGKGKGIIGAINYLTSRGVNSNYFLTNNLEGDGKDVMPFIHPDKITRYDCSRLDQWDIVFSHMEQKGAKMHVILSETENEMFFEWKDDLINDGVMFADSRKLYYRELIARFGHHLGLVWNIGEENGWDDRGKDTSKGAAIPNSTEQRKMFADYIRSVDAYNHPIVVHTLPGRYNEIYDQLVGHKTFEGPSLQIHLNERIHRETLHWRERSAKAGRPWFCMLDEIGPASTGVKPDADDPEHNEVRHYALWGNLMAGGSGCEWYFGYQFAHNDLNLEDFRSRENMWNQTHIAVQFFQEYLPFTEMEPDDKITAAGDDFCFAKKGEVYTIYLPKGESSDMRLASGTYSVQWFNPREGGKLQNGNVDEIKGPGKVSFGEPPRDQEKDWVVLIRKK